MRYLVGDWIIGRELNDLSSKDHGSFDGVASFEHKIEGRLEYIEQGVLLWPTYCGIAKRSHFYQQIGPHRAVVHFDNGDAFHGFELRASGFDVEYRCKKDCYMGRFVLVSMNCWTSRWTVVGPKKALTVSTSYERARADEISDLCVDQLFADGATS
jgi:hypothetical protein